MFSWRFLKDSVERAIRTLAQGILAHAAVAEGWEFTEQSVKVGLVAALASFLMSVVASGVGERDSASLVN